MSLPRLLLIFCVFLLGFGRLVHAERKPAVTIGAAPPQPVELNLKIRREGKTEIPLRIYGKANEPLKYIIRVPPQRGKLSDPRPTEREISVVVYEPPEDLSITTDKFSYAVQNSVGVSAAVEVNITILDRPSQLSIQDRLDFGTLRVGASNFRMLEISNKGGLIATGDVVVDPPWRIEGKHGYRLRNDEVAVFKIFFEPVAGGKFEGVARFTSDPEHSTTLVGTAQSAITANPAQWVLEQNVGATTRSGTFELFNELDEARTLRLKADAVLKVPAQISIPPRGLATVPVEATTVNPQAFDTEIHLEANDFSIAVPVHAPALAAVFRAVTKGVNFGRLEANKKAGEKFEIENVGGASGRIAWEIGVPFHVTETSDFFQPGEKKAYNLEIEGLTPGRYRAWIKFHSGSQDFDIPVEAEVAGLGQRSAPSVASAPRSTKTTEADPASNSTESEPEPLPSLILPMDWISDPRLPKGVAVSHLSSTSAVIEWPLALSPAPKFRVEMKQLLVGADGTLDVQWLKPTGVPIETRGTNHAAILDGLEPGEPWSVRIVPLQANGEAGKPLFTVDFQTYARTSLLSRIARPSPAQMLLVLVATIAAWRFWQRRRDHDAA